MQTVHQNYGLGPQPDVDFAEVLEQIDQQDIPAFELAFEDEDSGLTHRFACNEDGHPLTASKEFVWAVDNLRFVGLYSRNEGWK